MGDAGYSYSMSEISPFRSWLAAKNISRKSFSEEP
jgi:hypothetical protein